jgi:hypothetical protein
LFTAPARVHERDVPRMQQQNFHYAQKRSAGLIV